MVFKAVDAREREKEVSRMRAELAEAQHQASTSSKELKRLRLQVGCDWLVSWVSHFCSLTFSWSHFSVYTAAHQAAGRCKGGGAGSGGPRSEQLGRSGQ